MNSSGTDKDRSKQRNSRRWLVPLLILLLLFLLFLLQWRVKEWGRAEQRKADSLAHVQDSLQSWQRLQDSLKDSLMALDSAALRDSLLRADSLRLVDSLRRLDSLRMADSLRAARAHAQGAFDSARTADSLRRVDSLARAAKGPKDTVAPSFWANPPEGRFYGKVEVSFLCEEKGCSVYAAAGNAEPSQSLATSIVLTKSAVVTAFAMDSAGNRSRAQSFSYEVLAGSSRCGTNAYPVALNGGEVCVDVYEWPNQEGAEPKDFVSQDEAVRICSEAGKHLCSVEEWKAACHGQKNWKYPYGEQYNPRICATATNQPSRSGRKEGCRSWYGMQDMSGNLWEWTSTPAPIAGRFLVAGGSWDSQDHSTCGETKYSFYPQNQYPIVGFRCCR